VGKAEDQAPVPMGPIGYLINSVLAGKENARLVLIPLWVKDLKIKLPKFKWPFPKSQPRRPPLEYHERIPPTLGE
jgi:hypothetical protein